MMINSASIAADHRLINLMAMVEQGATASPTISVFANSWIFRGQLTSTHWFLETTRKHCRQVLEETRDYRKADEPRRQAMTASVEADLGLLGSADGVDPSALNLVYVTAVNPVGVAILIPAVRIPVSQVSSWSAVGFVLPGPVGGGGGSGVGVGVGFAVPLG